MPLVRKVIDVGKTSKAVIIPKSWLEYHERKQGRVIDQVGIEVDDVLKIFPIFLKQIERDKARQQK